MSGVEGIRILRERYPEVTVVALTVYDDEREVFSALCAGASGYLLKNTPPARLLESIREVVEGGAPMSPEVARRVIRRQAEELRPVAPVDAPLVDQPEIRLVDERRRPKSVVATFPAHGESREPAKLVVNERQHLVECRWIAGSPIQEKLCDALRSGCFLMVLHCRGAGRQQTRKLAAADGF